ncbi:MAG: GAF domain-containing protein [Actinomycetota bacterium]|nr:GAF domain-containing protein [Actinomycetota bacterium]
MQTSPAAIGGQDGGCWTISPVLDVTSRVEAEREAAEVSRSYLTLVRLNQAVVRATSVEALYDETCRVAVENGVFVAALVAVPTPAPDSRLRIQAIHGMPRSDFLGHRIDLDPSGSLGDTPGAVVMREGRAIITSDLQVEPVGIPWRTISARYGIRSAATLPLRQDGVVVAVVSIYSVRPGAFAHGVAQLVEQAAENVSFALDALAASRRMKDLADHRRVLLHRLVTAEESERSRIAADLHDEPVQALAAAELRLGLLRRQLEDGPPAAAALAKSVHDTVRLASDGLRDMLFQLDPPGPAQGWADAARAVADQVFEDTQTTWEVRGDQARLSDVEHGQALRIVKEALINVRKHAGATHVCVDVRQTTDGLEVAVTDDGSGLDATTDLGAGSDCEHLTSRRGHRGIATMRDRAEATGGWFRLERGHDVGTTVRFLVATG